MIHGVDLASYQGAPDFDQVKRAEIDFAITKITEGTDYAFPGAKRNRAESARVGIVPGMYHFARGDNPADEARHFLSAVGTLAAGEFLCLDWEVNHDDPVAWCTAWLTAVQKATGLRPFIYLNMSLATSLHWDGVAHGNYPLWLAKYDGKEDLLTVPHWGQPVIKQYTDHGKVAGINGNVDLNVFYGDVNALRRYGAHGAGPPAPPPPGPSTLPALQYGDRSEAVKSLQRWLNGYDWKPPLPVLPITGFYGPDTTAVVLGAQRQCGITDGDGRNIGPKTRAAFFARGLRV